MPKRRHLGAPERLSVSHALIGLAKEIHRTWVPYKPFGTEIDLVFVSACVGIGDFEERPMTASNVAHYIEMPRATVERKLSALIRRGVVIRQGNVFVLAPRTEADVAKYVERAKRVLLKAQPK